jgi:Domain of unknown function (DUF4351)
VRSGVDHERDELVEVRSGGDRERAGLGPVRSGVDRERDELVEVQPGVDRLAAWQVELRLVFDSGVTEHILAFIVYTCRVHRHADRDRIRKRIAAVADRTQEDDVQNYFYNLVVQEGFDKGLEKGSENGQRAMLLRLLGRRFGAVPEQITARVAAATQPELERWSDRLLDAASLDDVFAGE